MERSARITRRVLRRDVGNVKNFVGVTGNFLTLFAVIISYNFFLMSLLQPCNIADN